MVILMASDFSHFKKNKNKKNLQHFAILQTDSCQSALVCQSPQDLETWLKEK